MNIIENDLLICERILCQPVNSGQTTQLNLKQISHKEIMLAGLWKLRWILQGITKNTREFEKTIYVWTYGLKMNEVPLFVGIGVKTL